MKSVAIIGGGLAGLITAIELSKKKVPCTLYERKKFPFHRVCGEYISNEALPFLKSADLYPGEAEPTQVRRFLLSGTRGQSATMPLDVGGFGISRFFFDNFLKQKAQEAGATIFENCEVDDVEQTDAGFAIHVNGTVTHYDLIVGAFGKRSKLDVHLKRKFVESRSPYVGVKYHFRCDHARDLIALHNFEGGYCGVVKVENDITNVCYLVHRRLMQKFKSVEALEENALKKNPLLNDVLQNSDRVFEKPIVINEISFATKGPVENNILMIGDAAGMITPLCGNGMAMAIHSAKILSDEALKFASGKCSREELFSNYSTRWKNTFAMRLAAGRQIQKLFGSAAMSNFAVNLIKNSKPIARLIMKNTHGSEF